jgi:multiple sugar transport system permease protein
LKAARLSKNTDILLETTLFVIIALLALPIVWLILMSLKTQSDALAMPPKLIFVPTLQNFKEVVNSPGVVRSLGNSLIVGISSLLISLLIGIPAAYGLSRYSFALRKPLSIWILVSRMAPPVGMLIPFYLMFRRLGMLDTYPALVLAHIGGNLPIITWMLMGFFHDIPRELEEASYIDGCTPFGAFIKITLPICMNGILAVGIMGFLFSWNELMFATTISGSLTKTAPATISNFLLYQEVKWGPLTAAAVTVIIPALAFIGFAQKHLAKGLTFGALK